MVNQVQFSKRPQHLKELFKDQEHSQQVIGAPSYAQILQYPSAHSRQVGFEVPIQVEHELQFKHQVQTVGLTKVYQGLHAQHQVLSELHYIHPIKEQEEFTVDNQIHVQSF
ncbi:unnamed protein product [Paramecium sonneborni]|uniref:Uncharacterized protein n=1 Tax=Paramecium sonneborni TaxID=65129 RepID=A0A8S1QW36_9CILI|nr:unnamed protein product [Paramecium sonneborni]